MVYKTKVSINKMMSCNPSPYYTGFHLYIYIYTGFTFKLCYTYLTIKLKCEFQWDSPRYFNFMQSIFFKSDLYGNRKFQMEIETDAMEMRSSLKLLEICSQCMYVEKENGILVSQKYYCQSFLPNGVNPEHLTSTLSANGMLKDFSPNHT